MSILFVGRRNSADILSHVVVMDDSMNDTVYNDTNNMQMNTTHINAPDPANVTDTLR